MITLKQVKSFIEGNWNYYKNRLVGAPTHLVEQTVYRLYVCKDDCLVKNACKYCSCPPARKSWINESCNNGERFPNKMDATSWETFKKDNNIDIESIKKEIL